MHRWNRRGPRAARRNGGTNPSRAVAAAASAVVMESVESRLLLAADLVISEFMASNTRTLADEDGEFSDWVEIHNRGDAPADLNGWFLTDDPDNPDKWQFPAETLAPGEYLVVFASDKDRAVAGAELHANFRLDKAGEYLGLVHPDRTTVQFEYAPSFPPQDDDVSYGLTQQSVGLVVLPDGSPARAVIPTQAMNAQIGTAWHNPSFDDSSWLSGFTGIGYENGAGYEGMIGLDVFAQMYGINASAYIRVPFEIADPSELKTLSLRMKYDDGFVAYLNGHLIAWDNSPGNLAWDASATADRADAQAREFAIFDITPHLNRLTAGTNVLAIQGLNRGASSSDFLIVPELAGMTEGQGPANDEAFFTTPTPGATNQPATPVSTGTVTSSQPDQTFAGTLPVTLTMNDARPGAVIRYTIDRSIPTPNSPLYTGPLNLTSNTLLRARVFEPGKDGGPVSSWTYMAMAANVQNFESNLPVIVIDTFGQGLGDMVLTPVAAYVIDTSELDGRARMSDLPQYAGRSGLRLRGQSSQGFPKKQYAFETWDENGDDRSVPLLGMPAESDWVIYAPYSEKSLLQNHLAYSWSREMGRYASRTRFVEVFVNSGGGTLDYGDYVGVYILEEKIKRDAERVDIAPLGPQDNSGEAITGGYIFKIDKSDGNESYFTTGRGYRFLHVEPESYELTPEQKSYLYGYLNSFEAALYGSNFADPINGYQAYIDVDSWIDHHIMVELAKNIDGFRISTYFHKDRNGKIKMEPVWDYNLSMGNANYNDGHDPIGWYHKEANGGGGLSGNAYAYWPRLFEDANFQQRYTDRWQELRSTVFRTDEMMADIDAAVNILADGSTNYPVGQFPSQPPTNPVVRNFQRWNILGQHVWPNAVAHTAWIDEVNRVKNFLTTRMNWIDSLYLNPPTTNRAGGVITDPVSFSMSAQGSQIYYTLDGSDPRLSGGAISPSAILYTGPRTISDTTRIRARAYQPGRWSGIIDHSFFKDQGLRVSEVMYHPHDPPEGVTRDDDAYEFIELYNAGTEVIDLGGYRFDKGITFTFPAGASIAPGEYRLFVSNSTAFSERYPGVQIDGTYTGLLENAGERVQLVNPAGVPVIDFTYGDGNAWPGRADGDASSLEPVNLSGNLDDAKNWRSSTEFGGSPRAAAGGTLPPSIVINEVLAHTTAPVLVDAIELYNPTASPIDISGWFLSDSQGNYAKFRVPDGTIIAPGGYVVFDEHDFNPTPGEQQPNHFALDADNGDDVWLVSADPTTGQMIAFVDSVHFAGGAAGEGLSIGRLPDGSGRLRPLLAPSLGGPNRPASVGPVLISEVMYNHQNGLNGAEFIELHNATPAPIDISGWRFDQGIDYVFPAGTVIPAFGQLLMVPFDPLDSREAPRLNRFRSTYGLDASVPLIGGFDGRLDNAGETIRLSRPEHAPSTGDYIAVDEVDYKPDGAWPTRANGGGASLARGALVSDGHHASSWSDANPTPGTHQFAPAAAILGSDADDVYEVRLSADGSYVEVFYAAPGSTASFAYAFLLGGAGLPEVLAGAGNDHITIDVSAASLPAPIDITLENLGVDSVTLNGLLRLALDDARELGSLTVTDGAHVTLDPDAAVTLGDLSVIDGGTLDIGTGRILVRGGSLAAINAMIAAARNGDEERWTAPGITSTAAAADAMTTVAVWEDGDAVHVMHTYNGDANGDGRVNADDYFRIDSGFIEQPENPTYAQGDFNFDDSINADDYFLIDSAFIGQGAPLLGSSSVTAMLATSAAVRPVASEPEQTPVRKRVVRPIFSDEPVGILDPARRAGTARRR